jgi:hypothetical protein
VTIPSSASISPLGQNHPSQTIDKSFSATTSLLAEVQSENTQKLSQMSEDEISALQREIYATLDPNVLQMLKKRGQQRSTLSSQDFSRSTTVTSPSSSGSSSSSSSTLLERLEKEKLRWLEEEHKTPSESHNNAQRTLETQDTFVMQRVSRYRYDFSGQRLKDPDTEEVVEEIPVSSGLYHHGAAPHKPGYTLAELHHLTASAVPGQRSLALKTLTAIWRRNAALCEAATLTETLTLRTERECVLLSAINMRLPVMIRHLIDDTTRPVLDLALDALHALLCATHNDTLYTLMNPVWPHIGGVYPLHPIRRPLRNETSTAPSDFERMQHDLVRGLLRTGLLIRLRYLLEVVSESLSLETRIKICDVLTRIAYHSAHVAQRHLLRVSSPSFPFSFLSFCFLLSSEQNFLSSPFH